MTNHDIGSHYKYWLLLTVISLLSLSGCDDTFQPFQENDTYVFSIQGYLDASADTQWVRVGTVRQIIDEPPNPDGITVTLKDLESGETAVLKDSLIASLNVLSYWTTMEVKHDQSYEITAERTDGNKSRVTLTTPPEFPPLHIIFQGGIGVTPGVSIWIDDSIEHIADLQSVWYVNIIRETEVQRRIFTFPLRNTLEPSRSYGGTYTTVNDWDRELALIQQEVGMGAVVSVVNRQIFAASGGPEWNDDISSINDLEYFISGNNSNVENGLGYVVGVSIQWFHQDTCYGPDGSNAGPCVPEKPYWYP
tara:strand:- start:675 stop:1592 length:918 start_codon:yes stop_codon:yes gene_type:complete